MTVGGHIAHIMPNLNLKLYLMSHKINIKKRNMCHKCHRGTDWQAKIGQNDNKVDHILISLKLIQIELVQEAMGEIFTS